MLYANNKGANPAHPHSLISTFVVHCLDSIIIRVFVVCMKKAWILSCPLSAQRRLIRLGGCSDWTESLLGAQSVGFVMRSLIWCFCTLFNSITVISGQWRGQNERFCVLKFVKNLNLSLWRISTAVSDNFIFADIREFARLWIQNSREIFIYIAYKRKHNASHI